MLYELFAWLDRERPERFFAYIHFQGTHDPYYDDNDLSSLLSAPAYSGDLDLTNMEYKQDVKKGRVLTPEESAHLAHIAYGKAARIDRQAVRPLVERLEASKLLENTLVVVTSDHGDAFFEHGSVSHGGTIHDEEVHVPLVVHYPAAFAKARGFAATGTDACPASTVDLLPTALDFIGAPPLDAIDGRSLVPATRGAGCGAEVITERTLEEGRIAGAALVRSGRKLIVDYTDGGRKLRLYDLAGDPGETRDLASERSDEVQQLDALLMRRLNADGASMARWKSADDGSLPAEQIDALRELGYVD
jgi:arylsulfatase A-like enzyme